MKNLRISETDNQRKKRCKKNKENMRKIKSMRSQLKRLQKFQESVRYGPIFTCTVCEQEMFRHSVIVLTKEIEETLKQKCSEMCKLVLQVKHKHKVFVNGESNVYMCGTCKKHLTKGNLPAMAAENGLNVLPIPEDLNLSEIENNLIAKRIMFQKIYQLPKSRMAACKDRLINIPIGSEDVLNTLQKLPRTPQEAGLLEVKLKRKLEYKNTHKQANIDPKKIYKALEFLKNTGLETQIINFLMIIKLTRKDVSIQNLSLLMITTLKLLWIKMSSLNISKMNKASKMRRMVLMKKRIT